MRDAAANSFLTEVASTLKQLQQIGGQDFISYIQQSVLPTIKLPTAVQVSTSSHSSPVNMIFQSDGFVVCCVFDYGKVILLCGKKGSEQILLQMFQQMCSAGLVLPCLRLLHPFPNARVTLMVCTFFPQMDCNC